MTDAKGAIPGLSAIADKYDALLCDVWGVLHNGAGAFPDAVEALLNYRRQGGRVVLVTNAPRPAPPLLARLDHFGVPREAYDGLVSSGDVTRELIVPYAGKTIERVGPQKDEALFEGLDLRFGSAAEASVVVISDLDDVDQPLSVYNERMDVWLERGLTMICANPDKVVDEGGRLIYCAGAVADIYQSRGGHVVMAGKPYRPIYDKAMRLLRDAAGHDFDTARLLAVGDSVRTDARGAAELGIDLLFVTGSIHAEELDAFGKPDPRAIANLVAPSGANMIGYLPLLTW